MEDKSVLMLKNRIAHLEYYIKKNLEPTIMSLYMDIDRLNKRVKALTPSGDSASGDGGVASGIQATLGQMPNGIAAAGGDGKRIMSPVENAIQTMEMLKQRNRRMGGGDVEAMMAASRQSQQKKQIDN
jgi:hypothetical protein